MQEPLADRDRKAATVVKVHDTVTIEVDTRSLKRGDKIYGVGLKVRFARAMINGRPRQHGTVTGNTISVRVLGLMEGEGYLEIWTRDKGLLMSLPIIVKGTLELEKKKPEYEADDARWAAREAKLDEDYFNGWTERPFPEVSVKLKDVCYTLSVHDHLKEIMWWVALNILKRTDGQKALNRRFPDQEPTKKMLYWMDGEKGVIPPGKPYIFGEREMQTGVYALTPSNLPAPIMKPIVDWAKLALAKAGVRAPPAHYGAWVVICLYDSENDRLGKHCDNDYWAKEYNKIVLMTAIGSASLALNPTAKLKAPLYVADDDTVFIFNQNVPHAVKETKEAPRISFTVRFGEIGATQLFKVPNWWLVPPPELGNPYENDDSPK